MSDSSSCLGKRSTSACQETAKKAKTDDVGCGNTLPDAQKKQVVLHGQDEPVKGDETTGAVVHELSNASDSDSDGSGDDCFDACAYCYDTIEQGTGLCAPCRKKGR